MFQNVAWSSVSSGNIHACGIKVDKTVWCWGNNQLQQLGAGPTGSAIRTATMPVAVAGGGTYEKLSSGGVHTCGIRSDKSLWCWGSNTYGQLGGLCPTLSLSFCTSHYYLTTNQNYYNKK